MPAAAARHRLGLRARVTVTFALGALLLSVALSAMTYSLTRSYLLRQREDAVLSEAYADARILRDGLRSARPDVPRLLASVGGSEGARAVVRYRGEWFASSLALGRDDLPAPLREEVASGRAGRQRFRLAGEPQLAVGLPLATSDAHYFAVANLDELDRTLRILSGVLAAAAAVTTLAGAGVGRWASGRALQPLRAVADAAAEVAAGALDIRLPTGPDRDLAGLASSFNAMVDALQLRILRDARFASDVSHELRSPLTTLSASVQVLQRRRDDLPERAQQALDLLRADVERFDALVQDLLEISRADAGVDVALEPVQLAELLAQAVAGNGDAPPLDVAPDAADLTVSADKRRLERVIANLVGNARAYGGGAVRLGLVRRDGRARIEVDDAGPGVAPDERDLIFERFARGSASGRRASGEGVGLGLALVREHVRLHGGDVWVEDRPGGGARFVVELPVVER